MGWGDPNDQTPRKINEAIEQNDVIQARKYFTDHPEFLRGPDGLDIWLWMFARRGNLPVVKLLVELGLSVNERNSEITPEGPIGSAADAGHLEIVKWLLEHGADINHTFRGVRRCMPLFGAARNGHLGVVKLLVEHGADIHSSWHCMNALMHAQDYDQTQVVDYLKSLGVKDLRETTPPDYEAAHRQLTSYLVSERGEVSDQTWEMPGEPRIVIRHIPASEQFSEQTLFTLGLSDRRLPLENEPYFATELRLTLPADWPLDEKSLRDPNCNWPLEWLKRIAAELRAGTSMPPTPMLSMHGEPPQPLGPNTNQSGWMCLLSEGESVQMSDCRWINFHGLFSLYAEEADLVRREGHEVLINRFVELDIPLCVAPERPNVGLKVQS